MTSPVSSSGSSPPPSSPAYDSNDLPMLQALEADLQAQESALSADVEGLRVTAGIYSGLATSARGQARVESARAEAAEGDDDDVAGQPATGLSGSARSAATYSMMQSAVGTQMGSSFSSLTSVQSQLATVRGQIAALQ